MKDIHALIKHLKRESDDAWKAVEKATAEYNKVSIRLIRARRAAKEARKIK